MKYLGTIAKWNLKEGDSFSAGTAICEVETDKATVTFDSQDDGFLAKILIESGSNEIKVGQPIMVTVDDQADVAAFANFTVTSNSTLVAPSIPTTAPISVSTSNSAPVPVVNSVVAPSSSPSSQRVKASPLARKLAREKGIPFPFPFQGTGPNGRVVAADVLKAAASPTQKVVAKQPIKAAEKGGKSSEATRDFDLSELGISLAHRQTIAKQVHSFLY